MAITNFIPEVWSAAILEALRAKLVFPEPVQPRLRGRHP